jgi:hypothetical protein
MIRPYFWSDVLENIRPQAPSDNEWMTRFARHSVTSPSSLIGFVRPEADLLLHGDGHRGLW